MTNKTDATQKRTTTRKCPVCGHEAWRIMYGMVDPSIMGENPKTEFAGCCINMDVRINPTTGKPESGAPKWARQNPECRHSWW